jgi:hypothetical protein
MQRVPSHPKRNTQGAVCDEGAFILLGGVLRPIGDRVKKASELLQAHAGAADGPDKTRTVQEQDDRPLDIHMVVVGCSG